MDERSLGRQLREAREKKGIGIDAVAASTRIAASVLQTIERDEMAALPADVYARGFVRAYCRAVDLPEAGPLELLEKNLVQRRNAGSSDAGASPEEVGRPFMPVTPLGSAGGRKLLVIAAALVLVVGIVVVVLWR